MVHRNDLKVIKQLEEMLGCKLKEISFSEFWTNGYILDRNGNVRGLNLSGKKLADISVLEKLTQLAQLDLSDNQLSDISVLEKLSHLTLLYLNDNQISDISALKKLTQLTILLLNNNHISDFSALEGLKNLNWIKLEKNRITRMPADVVRWGMEIKWEDDNKDGIFLYGNPLESPPPEIIKQGNDAINNYFEELEKEKIRLMECKLLIVGNGEVGKTSLMKKLTDPDFQLEEGKEETTHGIHIKQWPVPCSFDGGEGKPNETVAVNIWDFGGQAIYHATHQFFLTKRSLYLFVWEARKEEEAQTFDYWLNIIKLLSLESPVIVVMNKSDIRIKHLDEALFTRKFKNIVTFRRASCKTGEGIPELTEQIRTTLAAMPHLRDLLPKTWMDIRKLLETDALQKNYISQEDYYRVCETHGLDEEGADFLSDYLHDLGVILHFRDGSLLERTVILNPEWATAAVYALIDTREIQENKGRFSFGDLQRYWDHEKFPRSKHRELIRLMEKFELIFNITGTEGTDDTDDYIIPELLPPKQLSTSLDKYTRPGILRFEYRYDFMPGGIISRFISRNYYLLLGDSYWKNGVVLRFDDSTAQVTGDPLNRKTSISIDGTSRSELMGIIRNELDVIHRSLNMEKTVHYDELIPCNCSGCRDAPNPHFFKYGDLRRKLNKGRSHVDCDISDEDVSIAGLIKGYEGIVPDDGRELLDQVLWAARHLMDMTKSIHNGENDRNDVITKMLTARGIIVKDQSHTGSSASGKSRGRPDFKFVNAGGEDVAVMEAFNLEYCDRNAIELHLKKLFKYDAVGHKQNFILVYADSSDFVGLWEKYLSYVREIGFEYRLEHLETEVPLARPVADINMARAAHRRNNRDTEVFHIFVHMKSG